MPIVAPFSEQLPALLELLSWMCRLFGAAMLLATIQCWRKWQGTGHLSRGAHIALRMATGVVFVVAAGNPLAPGHRSTPGVPTPGGPGGPAGYAGASTPV